MKSIKAIAAVLMIPALLIMFSKAEDNALWIQLLAVGYVLAYTLVRFRGGRYE